MLAKTPPMGFNTWNTFGDRINEQLIHEAADAMIRLGLKDAGYEYLVVDDCWSEYERDPVTDRIVPHHEKFSNGMKVVADYVHKKGLKFGMYSSDGVRTCADYPGSFDHEFLDARTFAEWGVDYLKYDNCYHPASADEPTLYRRMGMALRASGREILFAACNWGSNDVWSWIRSTGAHMYRSTGDIFDNPESYRNIARSQMKHLDASAPGCFNDMDMLTVGMYGKGLVGSLGCNSADYRSQFALWCMFSCPLMLGCDIRNMREETLKLVTNRELIAIDQDPEARPPIFLQAEHETDRIIAFKFLTDGSYALGVFNLSEEDREYRVLFNDTGLDVKAGVALSFHEVITDEDAGVHREHLYVRVPSHDCRVFRVSLVQRA
ncbi:MAG: glycoside hydrolase family 27 protein [Clostridia bacterium]|nr:glycoside hydrolase family 27 protein [Clostridia bacterium]